MDLLGGVPVVHHLSRRQVVAPEAQRRRLRPVLEVAGGEADQLAGPPPLRAVPAELVLPVDVVAAAPLDQAGHLHRRTDRVEIRHLPAQPVGAEGDRELISVKPGLDAHLEAPRRVRIVRVMDHRRRADHRISAEQVDDVVVAGAAVLDQAERGFLPVLAVPAHRVADAPAAVVERSAALVPHAQLAIDLSHRAVVAHALVVRGALRPAAHHDRVGLARLLAGDQLQLQAGGEADAVLVEGEQDRLGDRSVGAAVPYRDHGLISSPTSRPARRTAVPRSPPASARPDPRAPRTCRQARTAT